jgi:ATP-binding protein involved in chromosome partitioning
VKSYDEIRGDGGSRVAEQVEAQRARIRGALAGVRHVVAIGSGKGGVGKSTLTLGLAHALRRAGCIVAVLDADVNGPSQARLAGLEGVPLVPGAGGELAPPRDAAGVGVVSLGGLVPDTRSVEFETVARGDSHVWRATREFAFLAQLLGSVTWGDLDWLFVDLPPGAERTFQFAEFLGPGAAFVLVTTPSALAQSVVSRSVAALSGVPNRLLGYVENMSGYRCPSCHEVRPLFPPAREDALGMPCLGRVPFDPALATGPAAPRELDDVAAALVAALEEDR